MSKEISKQEKEDYLSLMYEMKQLHGNRGSELI